MRWARRRDPTPPDVRDPRILAEAPVLVAAIVLVAWLLFFAASFLLGTPDGPG
ncbi:MAG TPA: hypothetical protein VIT24_10645 [Acidimicrobiales bacterium]